MFHQMDAKPPRLPQPSKNSQPGNPKVPQLLERATPGATKWLNPRGQKRGPKNTKYGAQKWCQKSLPGGSLAIIIIRRGPFRGTVFWTPKMCSKACFCRPLFSGLKFHPKCAELLGDKQKHIHQSIHPENRSLPHLDIAVAGYEPHMAASSGKMPIKEHLLLLVLQKTACESACKL